MYRNVYKQIEALSVPGDCLVIGDTYFFYFYELFLYTEEAPGFVWLSLYLKDVFVVSHFMFFLQFSHFSYPTLNERASAMQKHEFHANLSFRYIIFHENKIPNDAVTPQRQSQFTPKMKANAVPRLLSSLV